MTLFRGVMVEFLASYGIIKGDEGVNALWKLKPEVTIQ